MCSTFFVHYFAFVLQLQGEISWNFPVTRFMEEISYVFLFAILSLPLIFTSVAISVFHFLTAATKINYVLFFFQRNSPPLLSISISVLCRFYMSRVHFFYTWNVSGFSRNLFLVFIVYHGSWVYSFSQY